MAVPVIKSIGEEMEKGKEERRVLTKRRDPSTTERSSFAQDDKKEQVEGEDKRRL